MPIMWWVRFRPAEDKWLSNVLLDSVAMSVMDWCQLDCNCFISASRLERKDENSPSLKMSMSVFVHLRWCITPHTIWCTMFGGYSVPSVFLISRTNLVSQHASVAYSMSSSDGTADPCAFLFVLHASHTLTQYSVSCLVFFGTACKRASTTSLLIFSVAKRLLQLTSLTVASSKWAGLESSCWLSFMKRRSISSSVRPLPLFCWRNSSSLCKFPTQCTRVHQGRKGCRSTGKICWTCWIIISQRRTGAF